MESIEQIRDKRSLSPGSADELAAVLREGAAREQTIEIVGNGTKRSMGGPVWDSDITISTAGLRRVLQYEPGDLTVSVEAGLPFRELQQLLRAQGQMIALDPPYWERATVGGVIASNGSGPMRRGFGTARDLVIGMEFAMLDGKRIKSGGMVVKNVAGLDMGKLMIGSFGTLAVITSVNFRLHPIPEQTRTFLFEHPDIPKAIEKRDAILRGPLQPFAVDLLSPEVATYCGWRGYLLAARAGGSKAVLDRYTRELPDAVQVEGREEETFWDGVREFTPVFLERNPEGIVLRVSTTLTHLASLMRLAPGAVVARAGTGTAYVYRERWPPAPVFWEQNWNAMVEFAPGEIRRTQELWRLPSEPAKANGFAIMKKVKAMFDPDNLLNRFRLYGRI